MWFKMWCKCGLKAFQDKWCTLEAQQQCPTNIPNLQLPPVNTYSKDYFWSRACFFSLIMSMSWLGNAAASWSVSCHKQFVTNSVLWYKLHCKFQCYIVTLICSLCSIGVIYKYIKAMMRASGLMLCSHTNGHWQSILHQTLTKVSARLLFSYNW